MSRRTTRCVTHVLLALLYCSGKLFNVHWLYIYCSGIKSFSSESFVLLVLVFGNVLSWIERSMRKKENKSSKGGCMKCEIRLGALGESWNLVFRYCCDFPLVISYLILQRDLRLSIFYVTVTCRQCCICLVGWSLVFVTEIINEQLNCRTLPITFCDCQLVGLPLPCSMTGGKSDGY